MRDFKPHRIYIDSRSVNHMLTKRVCAHFSDIPQETINDLRTLIDIYNQKEDTITQGKRALLLTINKGAFVKKCPGTKNYICCGYQILHLASQCDLDCSYCILQSYFNNPLITLFTNMDDMFSELHSKLLNDAERTWRIGTGEFSDSLTFDPFTKISEDLIPFFCEHENAILELKTKTANIENLLRFNVNGRIVIGWSLNTAPVVKNEERFAAPIKHRLEAARMCAEKEYKIAFHFDPLFYYPGWEKDYKRTVDRLMKAVPHEKIAWISLGCFRFMSPLKKTIMERFPASEYIFDEFFPGFDGKMRYLKPLRIHMYTHLVKCLHRYNPNVFVYLCMESAEVWNHVFGYTPKKFGSLARALDKRVFSQAC